MSTHKSTEERRYRMELAIVIGVGIVLAIIIVAVILTINPAPVEEQDSFDAMPSSGQLLD